MENAGAGPAFPCLGSGQAGFLPLATSAAIQRGWRPRPVQVSEGLAGLRYFGGTLPSLRPLVLEAALRGLRVALALRVRAAPPAPNSSSMV
jgi:hypothetical protein